jgi:hypothetical protein
MSKHGMETCQQSDVDTVLGLYGPILKHYENCGHTINSAQYCAILEEELKPIIHSKCRGILTNGLVLDHDNTQPHMTTATVKRTI